MSENQELYSRINSLEQRVSVNEKSFEGLTPKIHFIEVMAKFQEQLMELRSVVEVSTKATEEQLGRLAHDIGDAFRRLNAINEENMTAAAKAQLEKHTADLALREERLRQAEHRTVLLTQEIEDKKLINQIKKVWTPLFLTVTAGGGAVVILWEVFVWLSKNLPH